MNELVLGQIKVSFVDKMGDDLRVVNAARISFDNESDALSAKDEKLIDYLARNEHMSPFEHCTLSIVVECPLYIRSQIHRHRTFAYNEVSRRYTEEGIEFYLPEVEDIRTQAASNKQASGEPLDEETAQIAQDWMRNVFENCLRVYHNLLQLGVSKEQARSVLPQALMTRFYMTGNLRNFAHFVRLRDHSHAQKEAQYVARAIKQFMMEAFPVATEALFRNGARS